MNETRLFWRRLWLSILQMFISFALLGAFFSLAIAEVKAVTFDAGTNLNVSERPFIIATGDFNEDSNLDLVVTRDFTGDATMLPGNGDGSFGAGTFIDSEGEGTRAIAVADLDEDNNLDVVVANSDNDTIKVVFGNGAGAFSSGPLLSTAASPRGVAIADMNNDNDLDLIVSTITGNVIEIFPGDGAGGFGTSTSAAAGARAERVAVGDFNGDSDLDVVVTGPTLRLMLGDGAGNLGSPTVITSIEYFDLAITDFNGDNDLDIVAGQSDMDVLLGDGTGSFGSPITLASGAVSEVTVSDLDEDGDDDVIGTDFNAGTVLTFLNDGAASFTADATLTAALGVLPVVAGDFSNSGFDDLVVGQILDPDDQRMIIYLNQSVSSSTIAVDVGSYTGIWEIVGETGTLTGNQNVTLAAGTYTVRVTGSGGADFLIDVDAGGNVTSQNTDAATGSGSTLTFNNALITVDPGAFNDPDNRWELDGIVANTFGIQNFTVVPGLSYGMDITGSENGLVAFDVDGSGNTTSQNPDAVTASGTVLTFNTVTIDIDPGAYDQPDNRWLLFGVLGDTFGLQQNIVVVPALRYAMQVTNSSNGNIGFDLDAVGNITLLNPDAGTTVGSTLTLTTEQIEFTPTTNDPWSISNASAVGTGPRTVDLPATVRYALLDASNNPGPFIVSTDPCSVDVSQVVLPGITVDIACASTGPTIVNVDQDSFLRPGAQKRNEGANPNLHQGNKRRSVVAFDLTGINTAAVTSASLIFTIDPTDPSKKWGNNGREVGVHNLLEEWTEGNGLGFGVPAASSTRGTGSGTTWTCATDTNITNKQIDCGTQWDGGTFNASSTDTVLHTNGMTGTVVFDVTTDVVGGGDMWLLKKVNENQNGNIRYYAKEHGTGDAPRLELTF